MEIIDGLQGESNKVNIFCLNRTNKSLFEQNKVQILTILAHFASTTLLRRKLLNSGFWSLSAEH